MIRSVMSMFSSGKPTGPGAGTGAAPQLLSTKHKRKSPDSLTHQPHNDEEQTMEYGAMLGKPRLLSSTTSLLASHHAPAAAAGDHDSENNSLLSNVRSSALPLAHTLKHAALMRKASITMPAAVLVAPTIVPKEDSPPKKLKLNSGTAMPIPAAAATPSTVTTPAAASTPAAPLPPMPASISHMLSVFQLELDSRIDRLRHTSEFQIASLSRSFKNELNKVPAKVRGLTLAQFLDASRFEGDAALVMNESAMASQNRLESWVAATPKLRTSRKHREMMMATPSHSALLATTQRLTRASARKLHPGAVTGLGLGESETIHSAPIQPIAFAPVAKINLSDAVYETPSARGRVRPRVATQAATQAAGASMSIASLMASAVKSAKKKSVERVAPATSRRTVSADVVMAEPIEIDADTSAEVIEIESDAEVTAPTARTRKARAPPKAKAPAKPKVSRAKKTSVTVVADEEEIVVPVVPVVAVKEPAKKRTRTTKRSAEVSAEDIVLLEVESTKEEPPKRVTRARAKKGDSADSFSKLIADVNAVVSGF